MPKQKKIMARGQPWRTPVWLSPTSTPEERKSFDGAPYSDRNNRATLGHRSMMALNMRARGRLLNAFFTSSLMMARSSKPKVG